MALLDKAYKQRMVGALVLIAIAVIFLPMLFSRQDEQRHVQVDAPAAPQAPVVTADQGRARLGARAASRCRKSRCRLMRNWRSQAAASQSAADCFRSKQPGQAKPAAPAPLRQRPNRLPAPAQPHR
jgi:DedD protein